METIDMTPEWADVLPILIAAIQDGTEDGQKAAISELGRMARAADRFNRTARFAIQLVHICDQDLEPNDHCGLSVSKQKAPAFLAGVNALRETLKP